MLQSLGAGPFPACPLASLGLQHPLLEAAEADSSDMSVLTKVLLDPDLAQHLESIFILHSLSSFLSNELHTAWAWPEENKEK